MPRPMATIVAKDPYGEVSQAALSDADVLIGRSPGTQSRTATLPPLSSLTIDVQGIAFTSKTALLVGDPRCFYIVLPCENAGTARRVKAHLQSIGSLSALEKQFDMLKEYAAKHGTAGRWNAVTIDALISWHDWLIHRELRRYNTVSEKRWKLRARYNIEIKKEGWEGPYSTLGETGQLPGLITNVRSHVIRHLSDFKALGWGVRTVTHYDYKLEWSTKGNSKRKTPEDQKWKPDISPSLAGRIAKYADMAIVCLRYGSSKRGDLRYGCGFALDTEDEVGNRVPVGLSGSLEFESYTTENPGYTNWNELEKEYNKARRIYEKEQLAFGKATGQ